MDSGLKQRLIGAAVLVALAVIFLPMLVQGPAPDSGVSDVPLQMPDAPEGDYVTRDLPLVTPGAAPNGGAVGLDATPIERGAPAPPQTDAALAQVDDAAAPASASQAVPLGDDAMSAPTALPPGNTATQPPAPPPDATKPPAAASAAKPAADQPAAAMPAPAKPEPMLPATTAGGNYVVHFGSYPGAPGADAVVKMVKAAQLPAYREAGVLNGRPVQRVRIGPYATRAEAESARLRAVQVRGDVPARVVALDAEAAKPAAPAASTTPIASSASKPATASQPAASAAKPAASNTGFAVQLGAFGSAGEATALRDRLRAAGFRAFTEQVNTDKGALTRVLAGPVLDRAEADQLKTQVKSKIGLDGIVRAHP